LARSVSAFDLQTFVRQEFVLPHTREMPYQSAATDNIQEHIDRLWPALTRSPEAVPQYSSLLPLPHRYVVPGGRFTEIYYWDSYFTMLGLRASGDGQLVREMCDNFAYLIERYGHVPNGNRSYYLSRSQPPFFASMVALVAEQEGSHALIRYRAALEREYEFWMAGAKSLKPHSAHRRAVRLSDAVLNRYWDDRNTPREEAYREDVAVAHASNRPDEDVYRNLRAAAESGWDFSSRWFADGRTRTSIRTVEILPVDLNAFLYRLELTLAQANAESPTRAQMYSSLAEQRRKAIQRYLWNARMGAFTDYSWTEDRAVDRLSAATVAPLFVGIATEEQARLVAKNLRAQLLKQYGLAATTEQTGEQWDAPNGWAPLQWMAIVGLRRYGEDELANLIAKRWMDRNIAVYRATGKLMEKYDVVATDAPGGGGEYPLQDGFGWTNGVLRALLGTHY
jgi:alpha,alpha-trehalase